MKRTIRQLRDDRGESRSDLAKAVGVTVHQVTDWEMGRAEPTLSRLRLLTEHFGVRNDQIELRPGNPQSIAERLAGWS